MMRDVRYPPSSWPSSIGLHSEGLCFSCVVARGSEFQRKSNETRTRDHSARIHPMRVLPEVLGCVTEGCGSVANCLPGSSAESKPWSTRFLPSLDARRTWMHFEEWEDPVARGSPGGSRGYQVCSKWDCSHECGWFFSSGGGCKLQK